MNGMRKLVLPVAVVLFCGATAVAQRSTGAGDPSLTSQMRAQLKGKVPRLLESRGVPSVVGRRPNYRRLVKDPATLLRLEQSEPEVLSEEALMDERQRRLDHYADGGGPDWKAARSHAVDLGPLSAQKPGAIARRAKDKPEEESQPRWLMILAAGLFSVILWRHLRSN